MAVILIIARLASARMGARFCASMLANDCELLPPVSTGAETVCFEVSLLFSGLALSSWVIGVAELGAVVVGSDACAVGVELVVDDGATEGVEGAGELCCIGAGAEPPREP